MKALILLSGGINSSVSGLLASERGGFESISAIHFTLRPFIDDTSVEKCKKLKDLLKFDKLYVIDHGLIHSEIVQKAGHESYPVIAKRLMYKIANTIANDKGFDVIITGDWINLSGTNTPSNINNLGSMIDCKILMPVLTYDGKEISKLAKEKGIYELSMIKDNIDSMRSKKTLSFSTEEKLKELEEKLDIENFIKISIDSIKEE